MREANATYKASPINNSPLMLLYHRQNRIRELDGIRGIAISLVLFYHYFSIPSRPGSFLAYFLKLFSLTWCGVDFFFVLSGFLIGGILIDQRSSDHLFRTFYFRRAARILPPYTLLIFAFLISASFPLFPLATHAWLHHDAPPLWSIVLFLQNLWMGFVDTHGGRWFSVTWSLAIEEQAYLLLPFLVRVLHPRQIPYLALFAILSAPLFRVLAASSYCEHPLGSYVWPHCRWDSIAFGLLLAWAVRQPQCEAILTRILKWWLPASFVALAGILALIVTGQSIATFGMNLVGHTWLAASAALLILIGLEPPSEWIRRLLCSNALVWLGTISYTVYLFHMPVLGIVHSLFFDVPGPLSNALGWTATITALGITLLFAQICWTLIESKLIRRARLIRFDSSPN